MTYKIIIPIIADLFFVDKCLFSLSDWEHLLIVDNSPDSFCKKYEGKGAEIIYHPENIGVARSWNLGIKKGQEWTFLVSSSMIFPETFAPIIKILEESGEENILMANGTAWHCAGISKKLIETIGYFDENFYPCYYEDTDYYRRICLAETEIKKCWWDFPTYCAQTASAVLSGKVKVHLRNLAEYYKEKWGGYPGYETFDKPFGDKSLDYWEKETIETLIKRYQIDEL